MRTQYLLSDVALGLSGAAFLTAGITLRLLQPKSENPAVALAVRPLGAAVTTAF